MERRVTFNEIVEHSHDLVTYSDGRVALLGGLRNVDQMKLQSDVYMGILCTGGCATLLQSDATSLEVQPGDLMICHPKQFFQSVKTSADFKSLGIVFSPDYFEKFLLIGGSRWSTKKLLETYPVVRLQDADAQSLRMDFEYLQQKATQVQGPHSHEALDMFIRAVLIGCYDAIIRAVGHSAMSSTFTSAEQLVNRFIDLAEDMTPATREVTVYAHQLCVTPKYLSTICKAQTGMTARQMISQKVTRKLRRLFCDPELTVKEIAEMSGFKNLSFFGKYVKREMGASPRSLRHNALDNN